LNEPLEKLRPGLVSIGMPVYNGERYLREALDALLAQDYRDFELIVSDNCSEDATEAICREYAARDPRVRYYRNEANLGSPLNFRRVLDLATREYFMWAGSHDLWAPGFVSRCVEVMERDPTVVLCYPGAAWVDAEGVVEEEIKTRRDTRGLDKVSRFFVSMWAIDNRYVVYGLYRTSALRSATLGESSFGGDIVLLNELSLLGAFAYVPELLFFLRRLPDYGDMGAFLEKLKKTLTTRWSPYRIYWDMIYHQLRAVNRHACGLKERVVLMPAALFCILYKYWPDFRVLRDAGRQKRRAASH
jgi:glycosyltransferase involved in cell wall biosynthesis